MECRDHANTVLADRFHDLMKRAYNIRRCKYDKRNYDILPPLLDACECCLNILAKRPPESLCDDNILSFLDACEELKRIVSNNILLDTEYVYLKLLQQLCQSAHALEPTGFSVFDGLYHYNPALLMNFRYMLIFKAHHLL